MPRSVSTPQSACRAAIAWCDITPPVGIYHRMWGAATHERSEGVHRPLRATVLRLEPAESASGAPLLWLALDHCLFGPPEMDLVLDEIERHSGVNRQDVVIIFSHTHGAGLMMLDRTALPGGDLIPGYLREIGQRAAELIRTTAAELQPATIVYGQGRCDLAAYRDLWDEARGEFVCGFDPDTPADDTVLVARLAAADGRPLATLVNYACHPTTLAWDNRLISPDYIGALREVVEQATGVPCLFVQGASGELGPVEGFVGDVAVADRNGRQLGYAALTALTALPPPATRYEYAGAVVSGATIGTWRHVAVEPDRRVMIESQTHRRWEFPIAYRPELPTREAVVAERERLQSEEQAAREAGDLVRARDLRALVERRTRMATRLEQLPTGSHYPLRIDVWRWGDAVWVAIPGEHYSLLQTELRARFAGRPIVIATLAQGWGPSYIPTASAYGKGIYQETIAVVAAGSLERIVDEVARVIAELA